MTLVKVNNQHGRSFDGFVNEIFNDFPATFGKAIREDVLGFPPVNIVEKTAAYQLEVAAPGWNKTDFNLKLDGKLLTISAEKKEETTTETVKSIRKEFTTKSFKRSFNVDDKIDGTNISAKYENGILLVTLPKKEEVKEASKEINIQ
ncbi:MAG TPA: Hsp20/alpha crystallin family protein [Ferruginibacter sp.]|nr:Hsp20/alpha crystallin family protein [Ferruginibacter sp.]